MRRYDFILAGGGAAGLSLAYRLVRSPLGDRSILIVDKNPTERSDRIWSFWSRQPAPLAEIVSHSWSKLRVAAGGCDRTISLGGYRYQTIHGRDFYQLIQCELTGHPNVDLLTGTVRNLDDGEEYARVVVDDTCYEGCWIFDSLPALADLEPNPRLYQSTAQYFRGAQIAAPEGAFDAEVATFFDFRTSQQGGIRFFYVLPFSARRALVEYVAVGGAPPERVEYERALRQYLQLTRGITEFDVLAEEHGVSPMTDQPFPRRLGRRIMAIGALGGRIKPSSGFGFTRIQRDSAAIVQSLVSQQHPFAVPPDPWRYRLYDSLLLDLIAGHPTTLETIFGALFANNPIERVFRFLDETGSFWENLELIATLPPAIFLRALPRAKVWRRMRRYGVAGI
jgi:lycopene beta-cyclase